MANIDCSGGCVGDGGNHDNGDEILDDDDDDELLHVYL